MPQNRKAAIAAGLLPEGPAPKCVLAGQDYNHRFDVSGASRKVSSIEACALLCANTDGCTIAALTGGVCYPKATPGAVTDLRSHVLMVVPANSAHPCGAYRA